ncbi:MAG: ABC transporter substrate-binding protein [Alphaproteobacteria bacterium]|nr:ABC transporter substrate-binding protein [Alphaproteobacteria bacterium]
MAFKTIIKTATCYLVSMAAAFGAVPTNPPSVMPTYKVGVIQVIEHPALDETYKGIQDELSNQGFKDNLQLNWDSAQGNPALGSQIAQKCMGQKVDLIIAIGTTVAQAALSAAKGTTPIVFASVTDPKGAKLEGNITGVSNFVPVKDQFEIVLKLMPTLKRIGVIYNPGEANSASLLAQMQIEAKGKGLEVVAASASKTSEVPTAAQGLAGKVDAIFINNDNTALAALNGIGQICAENKIALFASDGDLTKSGALALLGADQYEIGRQTGRMVAKILRGEAKTTDLKIEFPAKVTTQLNEKTAQTLGITIPKDMKRGGTQS